MIRKLHTTKRIAPVVALLCLSVRLCAPDEATSAARSLPLASIVHEAMAASFLENPREVQRIADYVTSRDLTLQARGWAPTGCSDNLRWLWAESLATPQRRAAGYRRALEGPADERVRTNLRAALAQQPAEQIESTRRQGRWNRWADIFNSTTRNVGRLANGQIRGGVKLVVDLFYSPRTFKEATDHDRKEWWLIETQLRRAPEGPDSRRLRERQGELEARFRKDDIERAMRAAEYYAEREWWDEAFAYVRQAEDAGYAGKSKFRKKVRQAVADKRRGTERSLAVVDTEGFLQPGAQREAYEGLLVALASGDEKPLWKTGAAAGKALAGTPLADEAEDAVSILHEWSGDRRRALDVQRDLALRYPETQTGMAARARMEDPEYNPRAWFDREMAGYRAGQWRYVLTGDRSPRENVDLLTEFVTPSLPEVGWLGAFFVTDIVVRSVVVSFGGPVSPEEVLAVGEHLLADPRNLLTAGEQDEIRVRMGVLYEKLRRYDDAERVYRDARILSRELDTRLAERAADERFRQILENADPNQQALLLERLIAAWPETEAAKRAREHLERFRTESKVDFVIPREWLVEDPLRWIELGARVPYELIDGGNANGELNEKGLVFWRDRASSATFVCADGRAKGYVNLTPRSRAAIRAAAEMWADEKIALDAGELALASSRVPFEVHGSVGKAGLLVYPTLRKAPMSEEEEQKFR